MHPSLRHDLLALDPERVESAGEPVWVDGEGDVGVAHTQAAVTLAGAGD